MQEIKKTIKQKDIKSLQQLEEYESEQFQKAFNKGTDQAWITYKKNVKKACKICVVALDEQGIVDYSEHQVKYVYENITRIF